MIKEYVNFDDYEVVFLENGMTIGTPLTIEISDTSYSFYIYDSNGVYPEEFSSADPEVLKRSIKDLYKKVSVAFLNKHYPEEFDVNKEINSLSKENLELKNRIKELEVELMFDNDLNPDNTVVEDAVKLADTNLSEGLVEKILTSKYSLN